MRLVRGRLHCGIALEHRSVENHQNIDNEEKVHEHLKIIESLVIAIEEHSVRHESNGIDQQDESKHRPYYAQLVLRMEHVLWQLEVFLVSHFLGKTFLDVLFALEDWIILDARGSVESDVLVHLLHLDTEVSTVQYPSDLDIDRQLLTCVSPSACNHVEYPCSFLV